jgi:hypothetical protein
MRPERADNLQADILIVADGNCSLIYTTERNLQKVPMAPATSTNRHKDKRPSTTRQALEPALARFVLDPEKSADSLLRLRRKDAIASVLAHPEFTYALQKLAKKATQSTGAAVSLSRLALRPAFSAVAATVITANSEWPDPPKFAAVHRRVAADVLERARPSWSLPWMGKALISALPYPDLRRFFMSRLFLAAGGLQGAVITLTNSLSALKPQAKRSCDSSTLLEELCNCARSANPVSGSPDVLIHFVQAISSDRSLKDATALKRGLCELLQLAAAVDRRLVLEEPFLALAKTIDTDLDTKLRADAGHLSPRRVPDTTPTPQTPPQVALIREAAWSEADEALGRALQDSGRLLRSFDRLEEAVEGEAAKHTQRARGASDLVLQWVRQAARQRAVMPLGSVGDKVAFDPERHDLDADASPGDLVRLLKPPIVRGTPEQHVVLLRGEVELD